MDFLDPKKRRAHAIRLMVGYVLIAIAIILGTTVLLYQANGFGVRQGKVIQNGLVFVSSRPGGAQIYLDGQLRDNTGARLQLPAGTYKMELKRKGYDTWQRAVSVEGNSVARFDYPMLVPTTLTTTQVAAYTGAAPLAFQSPDRRFIIVSQPGSPTDFDMYDTKNPKQLAASTKRVSLPADIMTSPETTTGLSLVEASNDNRHFLLQRTYTAVSGAAQTEYLLFDRQNPVQSRNLTTDFTLPATVQLSLQNKRPDHFFALDTANRALGTINLSDPNTTKPLAKDVLSYKTYGDNDVIFATPNPGDPDSKTDIVLQMDGQARVLRTVKAGSTYLMDMAKYDGDWFVAAGAANERRVYIYKNPSDTLGRTPAVATVPVDVLHMDNPTYLKFSANTQFVMVSNGTQFAVYDDDADRHYAYTVDQPMDAPQSHADWMDGDRLAYVSNGKVLEFDYDGTNRQTLSSATPVVASPADSANSFIGRYFFDRDYRFAYTLAPPSAVAKPSAGAQQLLTATSLLTVADQ